MKRSKDLLEFWGYWSVFASGIDLPPSFLSADVLICAQLCVDNRFHYCFLRDYHGVLCLHILPTKPRVNTNLVDLQEASDQFTGHTSIV